MGRGEDLSTLNCGIILNKHYLIATLVPSPHWFPWGWTFSAHSYLHLFNHLLFTELLYVIDRTDVAASNSGEQERHRCSLHGVHSPMGEERHYASK